MISALISAGASVLGSLLGGKKSSNRINYKQMVRDAEAAGFNPLTAIRNGGSAGYMQGGNPTALSRIGDGLGEFGNFIANFDPMQDDKREAEFQLVQAQIANLNADTSNKVKFGQVPAYTAGTQKRNLSSGVPHNQPPKGAAWLDAPDAKADALPIWVPGVDRDGKKIWIPNPDGPDLEQLAASGVMRSLSGYERAAEAVVGVLTNPSEAVKVRQMSNGRKDYKAPPSTTWWPSFEIRWD